MPLSFNENLTVSFNFTVMAITDSDRYQGFLDTPPLWVKEQFGIPQFDFPTTLLPDIHIVPIPEKLRLGHQMEFVFLQCLSASEEFEVLAHNTVIREGKKTLGELDFILQKKTGGIVHVELTFKFYIINPEISEPIYRLMGPNKRDMFYTKMEKMKDNQFPMLSSESGRRVLEAQGINPDLIASKACFKAQLFVPYPSKQIHIRPLNKACIMGCWMRFETFEMAEFREDHYYIPYKNEWPVKPNNSANWTSYIEVLLEINLRMIKKNAPMVWRKRKDGQFEKFFVVWW